MQFDAYQSCETTVYHGIIDKPDGWLARLKASGKRSLTATNITVPNQVASGGLEQSVWDPATGTFFVSVPMFNGTDAGGVQEFSANGTALRSYKLSSFVIGACSPAGLTLGASGNLVIGCGTAGS